MDDFDEIKDMKQLKDIEKGAPDFDLYNIIIIIACVLFFFVAFYFIRSTILKSINKIPNSTNDDNPSMISISPNMDNNNRVEESQQQKALDLRKQQEKLMRDRQNKAREFQRRSR